MPEQSPFLASVEFAQNSEDRCACVLLLDTSDSMLEVVSGTTQSLGYTVQRDGKTYNVVSGGTTRLALLNDAMRDYKAALAADSLAMKRVDVSVITFGGSVQTVVPFASAEQFEVPTLQASGETPLGEAIVAAINAVNERKQRYKDNAIRYYRPWIFLITDGEPTDGDAWKAAAELVKKGERDGRFVFFAVGVEGADFGVLNQLSSKRKALRVKEQDFKEMFLWLSATQRMVSQSKPGEETGLALPPVTGWGTL